MTKAKESSYKHCHCGDASGDTYSEASLKKIAAVLRSTSLPTRLRLLLLMFAEPHCVSDLVAHTAKSQTAISHHLATLHKSGLVEKKRNGKFIQYSLTKAGEQFVHSLQVLNKE